VEGIWEVVTPGSNDELLLGAAWLNYQEAFVVGRRGSDGIIVTTHNAGASWQQLPDNQFTGAAFVDVAVTLYDEVLYNYSRFVVAITSTGHIYTSDDGGGSATAGAVDHVSVVRGFISPSWWRSVGRQTWCVLLCANRFLCSFSDHRPPNRRVSASPTW
jgi:hypothetical protein